MQVVLLDIDTRIEIFGHGDPLWVDESPGIAAPDAPDSRAQSKAFRATPGRLNKMQRR
jgi:hypothetical protein